jgi:hypothetical protein
MERVKIGGGLCNFLLVRLGLGLLYDKLESVMEHFFQHSNLNTYFEHIMAGLNFLT